MLTSAISSCSLWRKDDNTKKMYLQFDKYGELAESFANEGGGPYARLKGQDAMLVTFGENMK